MNDIFLNGKYRNKWKKKCKNLGKKCKKMSAVGGRRTADKTNDCRPLSLWRCVTPAGFVVDDQMFDRKLRKLAYGFLRVSLLRSDVERRGSGKVGSRRTVDELSWEGPGDFHFFTITTLFCSGFCRTSNV